MHCPTQQRMGPIPRKSTGRRVVARPQCSNPGKIARLGAEIGTGLKYFFRQSLICAVEKEKREGGEMGQGIALVRSFS